MPPSASTRGGGRRVRSRGVVVVRNPARAVVVAPAAGRVAAAREPCDVTAVGADRVQVAPVAAEARRAEVLGLDAQGAEQDPVALTALRGEAVRPGQTPAGQAAPARAVQPGAVDLLDLPAVGFVGQHAAGRGPRGGLPERIRVGADPERRREVRARPRSGLGRAGPEIPTRTSSWAGCDASEDEIRAHVRERLAGFEVPKRVIVAEPPKTSAAKIQKAVLRARSRTLAPGRGRL